MLCYGPTIATAYDQDLWGQIAQRPEEIQLTAEQRAELDRRIADHDANPDAGTPWPEARERIGKSL
jgi:putative addiction module component (TIGR02574 family)